MASKIPRAFIEQLLLATDIVDLIDARVPLTKAGKYYRAVCPFHSEKTPSFTVSPERQTYHCFGCGAHGNAIGFLMEHERLGFMEALENLASRNGMTLPDGSHHRETPKEDQSSIAVMQQIVKLYQHELASGTGKEAMTYLTQRGLDQATIRKFKIGFAPDGWNFLTKQFSRDSNFVNQLKKLGFLVESERGRLYDRFRNRIMFPIHDHRSRVVAFGGRIIAEGQPKYLNSPESPYFHKGKVLYGLALASNAMRKDEYALIVEGYMDVVALAQYGIENAVATLGTATTTTHLQRLFQQCPHLVFCFDGDEAGENASWRTLETVLPELQDGRQVSYLFLNQGEDPDSCVRTGGAEAFIAKIKKSIPLLDYLLQRLAKQVDLQRMDGRARLVQLAKPLLQKMPDGLLREMTVKQLALLAQVAPEQVRGASRVQTSHFDRRDRVAKAWPDKQLNAEDLLLAILLQEPQMADILDDQGYATNLAEGLPKTLSQLLELIRSNPSWNSGVLLEHFRQDSTNERLEMLAFYDLGIEQSQLKAVFLDSLKTIQLQSVQRQLTDLLSTSAQRGLTDGEKDALSRLFSLREEIRKTRYAVSARSRH